jgi:hypothetical protein
MQCGLAIMRFVLHSPTKRVKNDLPVKARIL